MAKDIHNEVSDIEAQAVTQIGEINGPTHLGSGDQINGTQINGNGTTIIHGDNADGISHTFNR
ncbi:hypothetical protein [Streptomyces chrestomyceticus]|uniref:hypothetical protein n=1 Tax=Streptomyces chrestomyceticus TaxID=68185 RepID=UPI0033C69D9C